MSSNNPKLKFGKKPIYITSDKGVGMFRNENDNIEVKNRIVEKSRLAQVVSGLKIAQGRKVEPYRFYPIDDGSGVRITIYNSTNPVHVEGNKPVTETNNKGIIINTPGEYTVKINAFKFKIVIPEQDDSEDQNENNSREYNKNDDDKQYNKSLLNKIDQRLSTIEDKDVPTVRDLWEEFGQLASSEKDTIIYTKSDGGEYNMEILQNGLKHIMETDEVDSSHAIRVKSTKKWGETKMSITSKRDIRERVGELWSYNESNNVVLFNKKSRREKIEKFHE